MQEHTSDLCVYWRIAHQVNESRFLGQHSQGPDVPTMVFVFCLQGRRGMQLPGMEEESFLQLLLSFPWLPPAAEEHPRDGWPICAVLITTIIFIIQRAS